MRITNLTPHTINIITNSGEARSFPASGQLARVAVTNEVIREEDGVEFLRQRFGAVQGLPEPEEGTIFVVSGLVRAAVPLRSDVASPGDLVRDSTGQPTGCRGLVLN